MVMFEKTSTGKIKRIYTYQFDSWQHGSPLTGKRQGGYFHCAASCVINSLCIESIVSSPGDSICQCTFAWLHYCSGSLVEGLSCFSYRLTPDYTQCSPVGNHFGLLYTHANLFAFCSVPGSLTLSANTLQERILNGCVLQ